MKKIDLKKLYFLNYQWCTRLESISVSLKIELELKKFKALLELKLELNK
jgi:hypothetical protein